jgi:Glycosyltransferase 61
MIHRSGKRYLAGENLITKAVKAAAVAHGLRYTFFGDNPSPSLEDTMRFFNEAVMVVAPHGAGLANLVFCEPGTYVVEVLRRFVIHVHLYACVLSNNRFELSRPLQCAN